VTDTLPIQAPAGYVPQHALAFATASGAAVPVSQTDPLPVSSQLSAATSVSLSGTIGASGTVGPFAPQTGRPIWVSLSGNWTGSAALLRSTDGGTTRLPATLGETALVWSANRSEAATEESCTGATYYLAVNLVAGSLTYRLEQ
jgi:hypothetical protein